MSITFYKLLGPVLEQDIDFVARQRGISKDEIYRLILKEAKNNQKEWFSGDVPNLNYYDEICRLAYLYIVAASNANTFKYILESNHILHDYLIKIISNKRALRVCSFGGGPGTELLGMVKFFYQYPIGYCFNIDFQVLDKVQEWANSWYRIRDSILRSLEQFYGLDRLNWPVFPTGNFIPCDVTDPNSIQNAGNIWDQDLYVINFLLSEVFIEHPGLNEFMRRIVKMAPSDAFFLFIERRGPMWQERIQQIIQKAGLRFKGCNESQLTKDRDEYPEDLGEIFDILSPEKKPRMTWNVVYCIGTK